ncbi:MAG TPA: acyltransferase family protein [Croceibacterium sp.]
MQQGRHYGMDWLRIGAFGLLILYHVGMVFVPWGYHVKTEQPVPWAVIPMLATNAWRMALLFGVSGFATAALLARQDGRVGRFLKGRMPRLLWPLLFGMAVIVPPQPWVELTTQRGYTTGYLAFWFGDYFAFEPLHGIMLPTWNHLWFLVYLLAYTLMLGLLLLLPSAWREAAGRLAGRALAGPLIIFVPLALLYLRIALHWPLPDETHDFVNDLRAHEAYFGLFLFGFLLARSDVVWASIRAWWRVAAVLAVAGYATTIAVGAVWLSTGDPPLWSEVLFECARDVQGWNAIVALIGLADRYWNRDHRWRATLNEAVFPFYVIHQTVIVVVAYWVIGRGVHPAAQFALLVAATVAGCWAFYLVGRAIPPLRPLIGLRWKPVPTVRPSVVPA